MSEATEFTFQRDGVTRAIVIIEGEHHEVHEGDAYLATLTATKASGQSLDILVTAPDTAKRVHLKVSASASGEAALLIYENPAVSGGTALAAFNRDRNSANTPALVTKHTPTVTGTGTLIDDERMGSGVNGGGSTRAEGEFILKQGEDYLIRLTSAAAGNVLGARLNWYEE